MGRAASAAVPGDACLGTFPVSLDQCLGLSTPHGGTVEAALAASEGITKDVDMHFEQACARWQTTQFAPGVPPCLIAPAAPDPMGRAASAAVLGYACLSILVSHDQF